MISRIDKHTVQTQISTSEPYPNQVQPSKYRLPFFLWMNRIVSSFAPKHTMTTHIPTTILSIRSFSAQLGDSLFSRMALVPKFCSVDSKFIRIGWRQNAAHTASAVPERKQRKKLTMQWLEEKSLSQRSVFVPWVPVLTRTRRFRFLWSKTDLSLRLALATVLPERLCTAWLCPVVHPNRHQCFLATAYVCHHFLHCLHRGAPAV